MDEASCEPYRFWIVGATSLTAYAILYYDYFLTLSAEVDFFWCAGSHTWASIVFLANRYIALLGHMPLLYVVFGDPCKIGAFKSLLSTYNGILILVLTVLTQVLLVMRVYALYCRNKWVLSVVVIEIAVGIFVACWSIIRVLHIMAGKDFEPGTPSRRLQPVAVAFLGLLIVDFTIFVLTIARSIHLRTRREPFLHRLFVDGILYYGVIWNLNLANIIILVVNPFNQLSTPILTNVLSVVMVSRLMIKLRDPTLRGSADCDETTTSPRYVSTVRLEEIITTSLPELNQ